MKTIYSLLCVLCATLFTNANAATLTVADLAGAVNRGDGVVELTSDVTVAAGDALDCGGVATLLLADNVTLTVHGTLLKEGSDALTIAGSGDAPAGIVLDGAQASARIAHVTMDGGGVRVTGGAVIDAVDCTFAAYNGNLSTAACLYFSGESDGNRVERCRFTDGVTAAIGNAANAPVGILIKDCDLTDNNTRNSNRPQINLTVAGDHDVVIEGCTVTGTGRTMVGGIGLSNLMALAYSGRATVSGCSVTDNRYGVACMGPMNVTITGCELLDNHHETNANNGGSGINLYDPTGKLSAVVAGNTIKGNLWGATIIGCHDVDMGHLNDDQSNTETTGGNTFADNGNGGVPYELYNNSTITVWAQNNTWGTGAQDAEHIEPLIFHKTDNAALGEVIYLPAGSTGLDTVDADSTLAYDAATATISGRGSIIVLDSGGRVVASGERQVTASHLSPGAYLTTNGQRTIKFIITK